MPPLLFASISYLGWAIGDIFGTIAARKLGGYSTTVWSYILRLIIFSIYIPFALNNLKDLSWGLFLFIVLMGVMSLAGFVTFNEGLKVGNAALVGTIAAAFPFVSTLISVVFLGESLGTKQAIAIFIIFIGIILSSIDFNQVKTKIALDKGVLFALVTMIVWGIWFSVVKIPIQKIGWFWPNYIAFATFPFLLIFMRYRKIKIIKLTYQEAFKPLFISIFLIGIAEFSYNLAIIKENVSIIAPIAGSYPTLFVILAFFIFKDPITRQQVIGIITTLIGIVLLAML